MAFALTRSRWIATRFFGRLGLIAATLSGLALAFHVGGQDGYTVPLTFLLGYPMNLLVHFIPGFALSSAGPASEWSVNHLAWCVAIAGNWAGIGLAMDLVRWEPSTTPPRTNIDASHSAAELEAAEDDRLLSAFLELERQIKLRERDAADIFERAA